MEVRDRGAHEEKALENTSKVGAKITMSRELAKREGKKKKVILSMLADSN